MGYMERAKKAVRAGMRRVAGLLNAATGGKLSPNTVTLVGFAMHAPIALLIAYGHNLWAAGLLVIFGLFDTLDGELARLQGKASEQGMLLDAATDRLKEVLLYSGVGYALALSSHPATAAWAAAACGASLSVSYVKAKGEAAVAASGKQLAHHELNHLFSGGFLSFEVRMAILVLGLLTDQLVIATAFIALFASLTALQRLTRISRQLA
jgi:phosphatidylglycerophosphate synthase